MARLRKPRLSKRKTSLHEAAHAVVAHHLGYQVTSVTLSHEGGQVVRLAVPVRGRRPVPVQPCPVEEGLIALAGMAAEWRTRTLSRRLMSAIDCRTMDRAGLSQHAVLKVLAPATEQLLRKLWPEVRRVAKNLRTRRWPVKLDRRQCDALLEGR